MGERQLLPAPEPTGGIVLSQSGLPVHPFAMLNPNPHCVKLRCWQSAWAEQDRNLGTTPGRQGAMRVPRRAHLTGSFNLRVFIKSRSSGSRNPCEPAL